MKMLKLEKLENIKKIIHIIRGQKVILDNDLATLYEVKTKNLNKAVQRNDGRFPADFMFKLNEQELSNLRFQIGTSSYQYGGRRYLPYAFTEQGVAMLSSVLRSKKAIEVNIQIMRTFVALKKASLSNEYLMRKINEFEKRFSDHDKKIHQVFETIRQLIIAPIETDSKKKQIGFLR